jgi:beta-lactamase superfamily II metal-dependent hydrolase
MTAAIVVEALPAAYGDCLWVECRRDDARAWRMVIDGGPPEAAAALARRVDALPAGEREIDVVVVTHIDSDHIGGVLPLLERTDVTFHDVWFNGLPQLPADERVQTRSVAEGEDLVRLLTGGTGSAPLPWNRVVEGRALATPGDRTFREFPLPEGPRVTLLSPTPRRLLALRGAWEGALARARRGEPEEDEIPGPIEPLDDLPALAATKTANDTSKPNGSSIAFLLQHRGASCLFGADAFTTVLGGALSALADARGGHPIEVDAVKVPHHGSRKNVSAEALALVPAEHYLISTNGERFGHPDDVALARVVTTARRESTVWFNYPPTTRTERWAAPALTTEYAYSTRFGDGLEPLRIELPERFDVDG